LLDRIESNGVRTVLVEDASRFARDLMTQELGILVLIKRGVRVITASGDDLTDSSDPARKMMRQVAGAFAEYEKARLVGQASGKRGNASAPWASSAKAGRAMPSSARRWSSWRKAYAGKRRPAFGPFVKYRPSLPRAGT
jgi:DNA invertase Pin-like site-specific DNA recombinase